MSEWIDASIGELTIYQRAGGTPLASESKYYGGEIPFVVIEDMTRVSKYLESTSKSITSDALLVSAAWLIKDPHILYSMYATVGKPVINLIPCATNQAIIALRENNKVILDYLYYALEFIRPTVWKYTAQTTQANLNASVVRRLPVKYPVNQQVQQKIVHILQTIDQAIEKTEQLIEKYQQIKAGLMHDLFTRGIGADGKLRPPREQAPELYQETPIGWIPKEWHFGVFGQRIDVIDPNPSHRYPDESEDGVFICSTENFLEEDDFQFEKSKKVPQITFVSQNNRCCFHEKDVVFARKGRIGLARRYGRDEKVFSHTVVLMKPISDLTDKDWLLWLARSGWFLDGINKSMNTNLGVPTLGVGFIKSIVVPFPDRIEQRNAARYLDAISEKIKKEKLDLKKLQKQKSGLMNDLLTGKVPVSVDPIKAPLSLEQGAA